VAFFNHSDVWSLPTTYELRELTENKVVLTIAATEGSDLFRNLIKRCEYEPLLQNLGCSPTILGNEVARKHAPSARAINETTVIDEKLFGLATMTANAIGVVTRATHYVLGQPLSLYLAPDTLVLVKVELGERVRLTLDCSLSSTTTDGGGARASLWSRKGRFSFGPSEQVFSLGADIHLLHMAADNSDVVPVTAYLDSPDVAEGFSPPVVSILLVSAAVIPGLDVEDGPWEVHTYASECERYDRQVAKVRNPTPPATPVPMQEEGLRMSLGPGVEDLHSRSFMNEFHREQEEAQLMFNEFEVQRMSIVVHPEGHERFRIASVNSDTLVAYADGTIFFNGVVMRVDLSLPYHKIVTESNGKEGEKGLSAEALQHVTDLPEDFQAVVNAWKLATTSDDMFASVYHLDDLHRVGEKHFGRVLHECVYATRYAHNKVVDVEEVSTPTPPLLTGSSGAVRPKQVRLNDKVVMLRAFPSSDAATCLF
jgi:hypothetical protein